MWHGWFRVIAMGIVLGGCGHSGSWLGSSPADRFRPNCDTSDYTAGMQVRCERQAREDAAQQRDNSCNQRYRSDRKARERCLGAKP